MKQVGIALVCAVTLACGGNEHGSIPAPAPSPVATATVTGKVGYDALPHPGFLLPPSTFPNPFPGATVAVVSSREEGATSTTDNNGVYRLQVPAGALRLRYSAWGYTTSESSETTVAAGAEITLPAVRLRTGPWAVAGTVTDSRGPIAGISVGIGIGAFSGGTVTTDSAGRYRYVAPVSPSGFVEPHFGTVSIVASGPDIVPESHGGRCCNSRADTRFHFTAPPVPSVPSRR